MRYAFARLAFDVEKWKYGRLVMQGTMSQTRACIECGKSIPIQEFEANQGRCTRCFTKIQQRKQAKQAKQAKKTQKRQRQ